MEATVIDWDGSNVPHELRLLPPGRYVLALLDENAELASEEDAAVRLGLDDLKAGNVVPLDRVIQEFESRPHRATLRDARPLRYVVHFQDARAEVDAYAERLQNVEPQDAIEGGAWRHREGQSFNIGYRAPQYGVGWNDHDRCVRGNSEPLKRHQVHRVSQVTADAAQEGGRHHSPS